MIRRNIFSTVILVALLVLGTRPALAQAGTPAKPTAPASSNKATPGDKATPGKAAPQGEKHDLAADDLRAIKKSALPEFHPQQPKRIQLDNGMVIFLQQ